MRATPQPPRGSNDTMMCLMHFVGPEDYVTWLYTDGSGELLLVVGSLLWGHDVSAPQRPQSNGVAEQAVRPDLEGTRFLQPGLPHPCWCDAANAFCALRNAVGKVDSDKTPYLLRHGTHC